MSRHYTASSLARLFEGTADEAEAKRAMHHLASCEPCLAAAADYLAQRKGGPPLRAAEPRAAHGRSTASPHFEWAGMRAQKRF